VPGGSADGGTVHALTLHSASLFCSALVAVQRLAQPSRRALDSMFVFVSRDAIIRGFIMFILYFDISYLVIYLFHYERTRNIKGLIIMRLLFT